MNRRLFTLGFVFMSVNLALADTSALDAVLENIRANESLYTNLELRISEEYQDFQSPVASTIVRRHETFHFVRQNGMLYLERKGKRINGDGKRHLADESSRFDGEKWSMLREKLANVGQFRTLEMDSVFPHMLPLYRQNFCVPLSVFLQGRSAMASYQGKDISEFGEVYLKDLGQETLQDSRCVVVEARETSKDDVSTTIVGWKFWLDTEHNYLPLRVDGYSDRESKSLPASITEILSYIEIESGIWFPKEIVTNRFDGLLLQAEQRQVPGWKHTLVVSGLDLAPNYPREKFATLEFPPGTIVHELDRGGAILSTIQIPLQPAGRSYILILWWSVAAAIGLGVLVTIIVRYRR